MCGAGRFLTLSLRIRPTTLTMLSLPLLLLNLLTLITANCPAPPAVEFATHDAGAGTSFPRDTRVEYDCDYGYRTSGGGGVTICLLDNTWYPLGSYGCVPVTCGDPGQLRNGERSSEVFTFGSQVTFTCHEGYELNGYGWLQCMADGSWNYPLPRCDPVECPRPTPPLNGEATPSTGPFPYRTVVRYSCDDSSRYRPNPQQSTCLANSTWSGPAAQCEAMERRCVLAADIQNAPSQIKCIAVPQFIEKGSQPRTILGKVYENAGYWDAVCDGWCPSGTTCKEQRYENVTPVNYTCGEQDFIPLKLDIISKCSCM